MPLRSPPYLPFLHGPPTVAPALKPISLRDWLLPDTEMDGCELDRLMLLEEQPDETLLGELNGPAARELLAMIGEAVNVSSQSSFENALARAATLVSDDLCLLERDSDGIWRLIAGAVTAPTYWSLPDVIGGTLHDLHGPVPGGSPELATRIDRVFTNLAPGKVLERFNWTVQAGAQRFTPERPLTLAAEPEDLFLRVERQTIRKLPETGVICFTIRVCLDPLLPILVDDDLRESFEDAWIGGDQKIRAYKGWDELELLVREACLQSAATG